MKKFMASFAALILFVLIFSSCSENMNTESSSTQSATPGKGTHQVAGYCVNNWFPFYEDDSENYYITYCEGESDVPVSKVLGGAYWSHYVLDLTSRLGFKACLNIYDEIKAISSIQKLQEGNYPKLQWNFVYSHHYVVQRKIGAGLWTTIAKINNRHSGGTDYDYSAGLFASYVDNTINLSVPHQPIYYRVYNSIFDQLSAASPQILYYHPVLNASISGVSAVYRPAKGEPSVTHTWTAVNLGGLPPFTYEWRDSDFPTNVISASSSLSQTYSYNSNPTMTKTWLLKVTDANGAVYNTSKTITIYAAGLDPS